MNIEWPIEIIELILEHSDGHTEWILTPCQKNRVVFRRRKWAVFYTMSMIIDQSGWSFEGLVMKKWFLLAYKKFGNVSSLIDLNRNFDQRLAIRLLNKTLEDSRSGLEPFLNEWIHAGLQDSALLSKD